MAAGHSKEEVRAFAEWSRSRELEETHASVYVDDPPPERLRHSLSAIAAPELGEDVAGMSYGLFNCAGCIVGGIMAAAAGYLKAALGLN